MNAVIDRIFGRIKSKQTLLKSTLWDDYKEQVLEPLAKGKEIDADLCEQFLEALGYDEQRLRKDVEALVTRYHLVERLATAKKIEAEKKVLQAKLDELEADRKKYWADVWEKMVPLGERFRSLGGESSETITQQLMGTQLNPNFSNRKTALNEQLATLKKESQDITTGHLFESEKNYTATHQRATEQLSTFAHRDDYDADVKAQELKATIAAYKPAIERLNAQGLKQQKSRLIEIEKETQEIQAELDSINVKALLP